MKKRFDSEPVYNEKYLKTQKKSYEGKINTNVHVNKVPKEGSQYICLSVILIHSDFRTSKIYYPQVVLEECKEVIKEKKMPTHVIKYKETSSDESDKEDSDEENSDKENYVEE